MSQTARLYRIEQLLKDRGTVTFQQFQEALEVSSATLKRDLAYLRDRLNVPIEYDRFSRGYKLESVKQGARHQLPGLWFSPAEIRALLTMHHLLNELDTGGLLTPHIQPLITRITSLMGTEAASATEITKRVKLMVASQRRHVKLPSFEVVGNALMLRKQLHFDYLGRHRNEVTHRVVSPQRLSYYRENWYLDALCHTSNDIRKFSVDVISNAVMTEIPAQELTMKSIDQVLGEGYGIYIGGTARRAKLRFVPEAARWIRHENWHPKQIVREMGDGSLEIAFPYVNPTELAMDILRHGENVEVIDPPELRHLVAARLRKAAQRYDR